MLKTGSKTDISKATLSNVISVYVFTLSQSIQARLQVYDSFCSYQSTSFGNSHPFCFAYINSSLHTSFSFSIVLPTTVVIKQNIFSFFSYHLKLNSPTTFETPINDVFRIAVLRARCVPRRDDWLCRMQSAANLTFDQWRINRVPHSSHQASRLTNIAMQTSFCREMTSWRAQRASFRRKWKSKTTWILLRDCTFCNGW